MVSCFLPPLPPNPATKANVTRATKTRITFLLITNSFLFRTDNALGTGGPEDRANLVRRPLDTTATCNNEDGQGQDIRGHVQQERRDVHAVRLKLKLEGERPSVDQGA